MLHARLGMVIIFIQLFFYAQLSYANNIVIPKDDISDRGQQNQHIDFIINLPHVTTNEVLQQINSARSALNRRKALLSKTEKESDFTAKDSAISIILPGGLLYAAIIKLRHLEIKNQLNSVIRQINELDEELMAFRSYRVKNTLLARLD